MLIRQGKKSQKKILQSFGFYSKLESLKLVKCFWRYEFSKMETFFWLTRYLTSTHILLILRFSIIIGLRFIFLEHRAVRKTEEILVVVFTWFGRFLKRVFLQKMSSISPGKDDQSNHRNYRASDDKYATKKFNNSFNSL